MFKDVRVTLVNNAHGRYSEELTADGAKLKVVAVVVSEVRLAESGVVLELSLTNSGGVGSDEDHLGLTVSHGFEDVAVALLVKNHSLTNLVDTGFDDLVDLEVDVRLSRLLLGFHCVYKTN